ncbi:MAG: metallophosphoesterase [Polyangiaceae bacterium]|nr:metallophosphoesterase [Polyangiaceae bacterium]
MSVTRVAVAVAILSSLSWLLHRYLWVRLVVAPGWPAPWDGVLGALIFSMAALLPLSLLAMRLLPRAFGGPIGWVAYVWMGLAFYLLLLTAVADVARALGALFGALPPDPDRRALLARASAAMVASVAAAVGLVGMAAVARGFVVKRVRVALEKLPPAASGYTIVQITDVHVGPTIGRELVDAIVRETNALSPDLVVITGDLVDGTVEQLAHLVEPLRDLRARDGVFFVTGNHEYYSGADEWIAHLSTLGVRVLRNERVPIGGAFDLAGVDDASAHGILPHHGQDVEKALAGRDPSRAVVLLAHQPKALAAARAARVDLQLSGHVHGGQIFPFNWLVRLDQPLVAGLYRVGETWVYVSQGTGYWGPPMRVGTRSELTCVELVAV